MEASKFVDYYEILEISPNANSGTMERMFRYLAQRYHPDNQDTGDRARFDAIMEAYDTLRDPDKRAQYDIEHKNNSGLRWKLVEEAGDNRSVERDIEIQEQAAVHPLCQTTTKHQRSGHRQSQTGALAKLSG